MRWKDEIEESRGSSLLLTEENEHAIGELTPVESDWETSDEEDSCSVNSKIMFILHYNNFKTT